MIPVGVRTGLSALALALALSAPAHAGLFSHGKKPAEKAAPKADAVVAQVKQAVSEGRLYDAQRLLAQAAVAGVKDARLSVLEGDVDMERQHWDDALAAFKRAETEPGDKAGLQAGEGISLSALGRSDEALATLERAVAEDPAAWRAWSALGGEYDNRHDWVRAEAAYDHALTDSGQAAMVLNNRGYSRLLQRRTDEAVDDFVAALKKKPDLAEARTNLRLAMAMKGDYDGAVAGGAPGDVAAILNNAGFAAALRGDYDKAEVLLEEAMRSKGEYYARASENMKIVQAMKAHAGGVQASAQPASVNGKGKPPADAPH